MIKLLNSENEEIKLNTEITTPHLMLTKGNLLIIFLVFVVFILIVALAFMSIRLRVGSVTTISNNNVNSYNLETPVWRLEKIEPSTEPANSTDLTLVSNSGIIRNYKGILSYGMSQDKRYLALNTIAGIEVITLEDNSKLLTEEKNVKFSGSYGDTISWNSTSDRFAISVYINDDLKDTKVYIFDLDGKLHKEIDLNAIIQEQGTIKSVVPAVFSKVGNLWLIRTYKSEDLDVNKDDGTIFKMGELPVYLNLFDEEGVQIKEFMVRDYVSEENDVYYRWNRFGERLIEYIVYDDIEKVDFTQDFTFTKIGI